MGKRRKKILIVEDEGLLATLIEEWLERSGYNVVDIAASAEEAIQYAEKYKPDLIMMDILLDGEMDGVSAVETIHQREYIPVIFCTACHDTETVLRANKTRHSGFIKKPISRGDLEVTVAAVLKDAQTFSWR